MDRRDWLWILPLAGLLALVFAPAVAPPASCPGPGPCPVRPSDETRALLDAHNAERAKHGREPLAVDARLQSAAQSHADHMARVGRMAHSGIGDGSPWDRIKASGYPSQGGGENVAAGQQDVERVMRAWMSSPGHRANILGRSRHFGGAVARDGRGRAYWCAVFGTPSR